MIKAPQQDTSIVYPARNSPHSKGASVSTQEAHLYSSNLLSLFLIFQHTQKGLMIEKVINFTPSHFSPIRGQKSTLSLRSPGP